MLIPHFGVRSYALLSRPPLHILLAHAMRYRIWLLVPGIWLIKAIYEIQFAKYGSLTLVRSTVARLACIRHAASVRPEPGSNSPNWCLTCSLLFYRFFAYPEGFARQLLLVVQFSKSNLFFRVDRVSRWRPR